METILELARRLHGLDTAEQKKVLQDFVDEQEFPLVSDSGVVFFYWNPERRPDKVELVHWIFGLKGHHDFQRIQGTHAFYLPMDLPEQSRVEYQLRVTTGDKVAFGRDPRNDKLAFDPFGANSVATGPGYEAPEWTHEDPEAERGKLVEVELPETVWGEPRTLTVYTPARMRPTENYPLLICHDGADFLRYGGLATVLDNLIHRREVAPIIVACTSGTAQRNVEYGANPTQARFIHEDVFPRLMADFPVDRRRERRGLMGSSFGAVTSLFTHWQDSQPFGNLLLMSGSFVFTDIGAHDRGPLFDPVVAFTQEVRKDPGRIRARVFMSCGRFESLIWYNRALVPVLRGAGLDVRFVESNDGHNWIGWRDRLRDGLTWLFPGPLWMYYP